MGNHTDILPLDLGISKAAEGDNVLPVFRVTNRATGAAEEVTDLGRAVLTGRFADLGKQKGPTLRALSARAPYFHNGAADNLTELIQFYDRRFGDRLPGAGDRGPARVPRGALDRRERDIR